MGAWLKILAVGMIIACLSQVSATCVCGAKGINECSCSKHIVRPLPLAKVDFAKPRTVCKTIHGAQEFKPVGDTCSCGNHIVKPAIPPRPCEKINWDAPASDGGDKASYSGVNSGCSGSNGKSDYVGANFHPENVYVSTGSPPKPIERNPTIPADAVSISLAYHLNRLRNDVPEDQVQYGFRKQPIDGTVYEEVPNVPEEKLWSLDRSIIELRHRPFAKKVEVEEEPEEEEEYEEEKDNDQHGQVTYLSYSDLGYSPERFKNPSFDVHSGVGYDSTHHEQYHSTGCKDSYPSEIGKCGFKPGSVVSGHEVSKHHQQGEWAQGGWAQGGGVLGLFGKNSKWGGQSEEDEIYGHYKKSGCQT